MNTARPGRLLRRIPGKARPQAQALQEWHEHDQQVRPDVPYVLRRMFLPEPRKIYRWRVALSCGCVIEEWTLGADDFPDTRQADDPLVRGAGCRLRERERQCQGQHPEAEHDTKSYQRIVEWIADSREVHEYEADPVEPPKDWNCDPELWVKIRYTQRHQAASWIVKLDCGHYRTAASSVAFRPEAGPRRTSPKRLAEMKAEWAEFRTENPAADDDPDEAHHLRMLEEGWPIPPTEADCYWCSGRISVITAYQRVGWLEGDPKPRRPVKRKRQVLEERLARLDAEQKQLRQQLSELHEET